MNEKRIQEIVKFLKSQGAVVSIDGWTFSPDQFAHVLRFFVSESPIKIETVEAVFDSIFPAK